MIAIPMCGSNFKGLQTANKKIQLSIYKLRNRTNMMNKYKLVIKGHVIVQPHQEFLEQSTYPLMTPLVSYPAGLL